MELLIYLGSLLLLGAGSASGVAVPSELLLETGDSILLEDGTGVILLEA